MAGHRWMSRGARLATATVAGGLVAAGAVAGVWSGHASAATDPGIGSSYAQGFQVTPHEGSLAIGAVFDEALAGHTATIARSQSQGLDLGAVGTSLSAYNCNQPPTALAKYVPQPLQAETPDSGGQAQSSAGPNPNQNNADGSVEHVVANSTPYGEADTTFGGQIAAPGNLLTVANVASKAWSGLVSGVRQAGASVDIGSVGIGGAVTLSSLHWDVTYPSGAGAGAPVSGFQIGKVTVAGQTIPSNNLAAVGNAINQALAQLGIQVLLPAPSTAQGTAFESPLQIEVIPSNTRDQIVDPVITNGVEPKVYPVANGLENGFASSSPPYNALAPTEKGAPGSPQQQLQTALCQTDTAFTVMDVTVASFTAGGFFNVALGGVNASSGALPANQYNLSAFSPFSLPGSTQTMPGSGGSAAVAATPSQPGTTGSGPTSASSPGGVSSSGASPSAAGASSGGTSSAPVAASPAASIAGAASGPLLGVGLGVLGLLLLLAEADRRVIRRTTPSLFEE